jgi:hypothetical protein
MHVDDITDALASRDMATIKEPSWALAQPACSVRHHDFLVDMEAVTFAFAG